jgi:hypothetical protein
MWINYHLQLHDFQCQPQRCIGKRTSERVGL